MSGISNGQNGGQEAGEIIFDAVSGKIKKIKNKAELQGFCCGVFLVVFIVSLHFVFAH